MVSTKMPIFNFLPQGDIMHVCVCVCVFVNLGADRCFYGVLL